MSRFADYAVVYDISSNDERVKVARVLKGYGFRIQKSVFECRLSRSGREKMIKELEGLGIKTGSIKIYRLEYSWKAPIIGKQGQQKPDEDSIFFV